MATNDQENALGVSLKNMSLDGSVAINAFIESMLEDTGIHRGTSPVSIA
jgi:hypothetical protein